MSSVDKRIIDGSSHSETPSLSRCENLYVQLPTSNLRWQVAIRPPELLGLSDRMLLASFGGLGA